MVRLPHLQLRHPIKNFAGVEVAEDSPLKLQKKWRMNRIAQIKQDIWSSQAIEQPPFRHPHAIDRLEIVSVTGRFLVKQTISPGKPVLAQSALETANVRLVNAPIFRCRQ